MNTTLKDLHLNQARVLSGISTEKLKTLLKEIRPQFDRPLSDTEYEELERIRCTFYYKVNKDEK